MHLCAFDQSHGAIGWPDERNTPDMIASLSMYIRPEVAPATLRYWAAIRAALASYGIATPLTLSNDEDQMKVWRAPDLVLSQTCGMPYRTALHEHVRLIGTPDFGLSGLPPGHYNSAFVVRKNDPRNTLEAFEAAKFAYNSTCSQSGYAAAWTEAQAMGFWFEDRVQSHAHRASAQMVASGHADIAAIDAVTWNLIEKHDGYAQDLRVLCRTRPTPGLPYIAAANADIAATFDAVAVAIAGLSTDDKAALGLKSIVHIPQAAYLAVPNPPDAVI